MVNRKSISHRAEKYSDNNKKAHSTKVLEIVPKFLETSQKTLFGGPIIKTPYKMNKNQRRLLGIFVNNPDTKFTRNILASATSGEMCTGTITYFLKMAEGMEFIKKCKKIKGTTINTIMQFYQEPTKFDDGTLVPDVRAVYYKITQLGGEVWNLNQKS